MHSYPKKEKKEHGKNNFSVIPSSSYCYLIASCLKSLLVYCSTKPVYVSGTRSSTKILELWKVNLWNISKMPCNIYIVQSIPNHIRIKNYFHHKCKKWKYMIEIIIMEWLFNIIQMSSTQNWKKICNAIKWGYV